MAEPREIASPLVLNYKAQPNSGDFSIQYLPLDAPDEVTVPKESAPEGANSDDSLTNEPTPEQLEELRLLVERQEAELLAAQRVPTPAAAPNPPPAPVPPKTNS